MVTRQWNRLLLVALIAALVCAFAVMSIGVSAQEAAVNTAVQPEPRSTDWWMPRHEEKNARIAEGNVDLLFIGDSITHSWENSGKPVWDEYYGDRNAVNLGFSGDRTQHVLWRLDNGNIDGINPKLAVIMIGTNNARDNSAQEISDGIVAIVEKLRDELPEMKILLLGVFPREEKPGEMRAKLDEVNDMTKDRVAGIDNVRFLDIGAAFLDDDGTLPASVMPDFLHPNEEGYKIWAEVIEPHVAEMMGEAPEFTELFNGSDLSGWEQVGGANDSWNAEDGLLYTTGVEGGGWLSTAQEYGDFVLELEFRVPENGNSGVFIRAPRTGNPAFEGSEIQVLDDYGSEYTDLKPWQYTGSLYSTEAPERRVTKPAGEWQKMRIYTNGPVVRVTVNDEMVTFANQDEHPDKLEDHPGLKRYEGYIGFQNHGSRLDYRNIRLREVANE